MVHREGCAPNHDQWIRFLSDVDQRVADAIAKYKAVVGGLTGHDFAEAYRALAGFQGCGQPTDFAFTDLLSDNSKALAMFQGRDQPTDPDYSLKAMPVAYALRWAPQRMTTVLSALDALYRRGPVRPLRAVLDLGSGTDASSLALEAAQVLEADHQILAIDRSEAMLTFSKLMQVPLTRNHRQGKVPPFDELVGSESYDAVFLSYFFDYAALQEPQTIRQITHDILSRLSPGGFLMYIGPAGEEKRQIAEKLRKTIGGCDGFHVEELGDGWPAHLQRNYNMPRMKRLFDKSLREAREAGLEQWALDRHFNPQTDLPSIIFTHTPKQLTNGAITQIVFAAVRDG